MATPKPLDTDGEPTSSGRFKRARQESGTRRIVPEGVDGPFEGQPESVDPWASDAPQSLLSVASWLVDSVRGRADSRPVDYAPSITVAQANLTAEEQAAIDAEWSVEADVDSEVELGHTVLSSDEAEAIDDFDLAPLRHSFERGDHLALLVAAEALLEVRPNMGAALRYLASARESLRRRYITELGGQPEIPHRLPPRNGVSRRVDPQEAFMLSLIDGISTLEEIVDRSQLPEGVALILMDRLCELGLVGCGSHHARYC